MKGAILWLERLVLNAENKPSGTRETGWYVLAVTTPLLFLLIKGWEEKERNALFVENSLGLMDAVIIAVPMNDIFCEPLYLSDIFFTSMECHTIM